MTLELPETEPGTIHRGYLDVVDQLPTGAPEQLPLIVADGEREGPTLWVTGSIHGNEVTGVAVCQDVVHDALPEGLAGRVVSVPNLNPAGLRRNRRTSYYDNGDPNRKFPDVEYVQSDAGPGETVDGPRPPNQQAIICRRIFDLFADDADVLLDMHTAMAGAHPFTIRDRVFYGRGLRDEQAARELSDELAALADAFGLPVVFEFPPAEYLDRNLQRTATGSALNHAGIPALTIELGQHNVVEDEWHRQGVAGTCRVMELLGMVEDATAAFRDDLGPFPDPVEPPMEGQTRRYVGPHVDPSGAGIVRHEVNAGDAVNAGDVVARVVSPNGREKAEITTDHAGWVVQRYPGVAGYENAPVASLAIEDNGDTVAAPSENGE